MTVIKVVALSRGALLGCSRKHETRTSLAEFKNASASRTEADKNTSGVRCRVRKFAGQRVCSGSIPIPVPRSLEKTTLW